MDLDPAFLATVFLSLVFSLTIHEAAHAATAYLCGDDTAYHQGRLTLNPIVHADLLGTIILPIIMLVSGTGMIFGWAKPVPFNPRRLNNVRRDPVLIAMAGPASNLVLATLGMIVARLLEQFVGLDNLAPMVGNFLLFFIFINLILMLFNLIPVPPLDGHHFLNYFLPPDAQRFMQQIGPFGILIAIIVAQPLFKYVMPILDGLVARAVF